MEPESVADWYLRRGLDFSFADRIKELVFLVAAEKITAGEVVKFIQIWGLEEGTKTRTWRIWVSEVRKIAAVHPHAFVCLAQADDNKLVVSASLQKPDVSPVQAKTRSTAGRPAGGADAAI